MRMTLVRCLPNANFFVVIFREILWITLVLRLKVVGRVLNMQSNTRILALIIFPQFLCTSLWFAGNAIVPDLVRELDLDPSVLGAITSVVQLGFIVGTLVYALLSIPDRFKPSIVFFISAVLGAVFNMAVAIDGISYSEILLFRFMTGFFIAGIYPVGMKITADYVESGLGKILSFLVAALVLGTAFPHLIASLETSFDWKAVMYGTSVLAVLGGLIILLFVPPGPYRKPGLKVRFREVFRVFRKKEFRAASFGYFGHMWELYAFWAFVPTLLAMTQSDVLTDKEISLLSFLIIGLGSVACLIGGLMSDRLGTKKVATFSLALSGVCCLLSPILFVMTPAPAMTFLILWGFAVIADSPLFSALVAFHADSEIKGTALTIVTSIGFAITIVSIQLLVMLIDTISFEYLFLFLIPGPLLGVLSLMKNTKKKE